MAKGQWMALLIHCHLLSQRFTPLGHAVKNRMIQSWFIDSYSTTLRSHASISLNYHCFLAALYNSPHASQLLHANHAKWNSLNIYAVCSFYWGSSLLFNTTLPLFFSSLFLSIAGANICIRESNPWLAHQKHSSTWWNSSYYNFSVPLDLCPMLHAFWSLFTACHSPWPPSVELIKPQDGVQAFTYTAWKSILWNAFVTVHIS